MPPFCSTGQKAALRYARSNFSMFQRSHLAGIQRLMGCLCYAKRPAKNPYKDLMSPTLWEEAARDFARHCCGLMGQVGFCGSNLGDLDNSKSDHSLMDRTATNMPCPMP